VHEINVAGVESSSSVQRAAPFVLGMLIGPNRRRFSEGVRAGFFSSIQYPTTRKSTRAVLNCAAPRAFPTVEHLGRSVHQARPEHVRLPDASERHNVFAYRSVLH
jgi:hypothetical protein